MQSTADEAETIHVELKNMMIAWQRHEAARKQRSNDIAMQSTADEAETIHVELKNMMIAWQRNEPARKQQGSASVHASINTYWILLASYVSWVDCYF